MPKIGFDSSGYNYDDCTWQSILDRIERQLKLDGLPSLHSNAWNEWNGGCVFEGTENESQRVQAILALCAVTVWSFDQYDQPRKLMS